VLAERRVGFWADEWTHLKDELHGVPYLAFRAQRICPPARMGGQLPAVRGVWGFKLGGEVPESLVSLAESIRGYVTQEDGRSERGF
jgi:hypothetical protein